ncbi:MAG: flagellin, partial [Aquificaceae bacterium]
DDSAGLFIADQLMVVGSGLEEGNRNIQTGLSALRIAESSAGQIFNRLNEIYKRTVRAANDINDPNARASLQREINNLVDATQKIGTDTEYNGIKLLNGTFTNKYIHYGPRYGQTVLINISDIRAQSLGAHIVSGNGRVVTSAANQAISNIQTNNNNFAVASGESLRVAGQVVLGTATTNVATALVDAAMAARNINADPTLQSFGIEAVAKNRSVAQAFTGVVQGDAGDTVSLHFFVGARDVTAANFSITGITVNTTLADLVTQINSQASATNTPVSARAENGRLVLETTNGETIAIEAQVTTDAGTTGNVRVNFSQLLQGASDVTNLANTQRAYAVRVGELQIYGVDSFVVNETGIDIVGATGPDATLNSTFNNLYAINVSDNQNAEIATLIVKKALQRVDTVRAQIGAVMNNLQSIYDSQKVALDNTREAENVIRNTDYAEEMTNFVKLQIKMQSSMAMLAQANQLPQLVLQLLR